MAVEKYASKGNLERFKSKYDDEIDGKIAAQGVPSGGTAGQVLAKQSATDYDVDWEDFLQDVTIYSGGRGNSISINSMYTTEMVYFVEWFLPLVSSTGKTPAEATSGDLVWIDSSNSTPGLYIIDRYDTIDYYGTSKTVFVLKTASGQPAYLGLFPTVDTSNFLTTSNRTQSITTSTTNVPSTNAVKTYVDDKLVPSGGTAGQVLSKKSDTDYDTEWVTPSGGGSAPSIYRVSRVINSSDYPSPYYYISITSDSDIKYSTKQISEAVENDLVYVDSATMINVYTTTGYSKKDVISAGLYVIDHYSSNDGLVLKTFTVNNYLYPLYLGKWSPELTYNYSIDWTMEGYWSTTKYVTTYVNGLIGSKIGYKINGKLTIETSDNTYTLVNFDLTPYSKCEYAPSGNRARYLFTLASQAALVTQLKALGLIDSSASVSSVYFEGYILWT